MSGYVFVIAPCLICNVPFSFNPHKVPSWRRTPTSEKEPVCGNCMVIINEKRKQLGNDPFPIDPEAYEPIPESEF